MTRTGPRAFALFAIVLGRLIWGPLGCGAAEDVPPGTPDEDVYGIEVGPDQLEHWSFQPISESGPPTASIANWSANPIDAFVIRQLSERQLEPSPPAEPHVWLRRVYFDLIGLPPAPEVVAEFLNDPSLVARERIVDRLLADPGYGIRWGRRWLDLVRYADTNGYERDGDKPSAWRYRDYVIQSLNADKPFDEFLVEQIAGDEVDQVTAETMTALTFLRLGTWDDEPADPLVDRYDQLDDIVKAVSTTFLGLTLNCARCHNHKFEPLSQLDYARFMAVFAPLKRPQQGRTEFDVNVGTPAEIQAYEAATARSEAVRKPLAAQLTSLKQQVTDRLLALSPPSDFSPEVWDAFRTAPAQRNADQKALVKKHQEAFDRAVRQQETTDESRQRTGFEDALKALSQATPTPLPKAYIFEEDAVNVPPMQVFRRGDPTTPAGAVEPGVPTVLAAALSGDYRLEIPQLTGAQSTGRRLALARWLASPRNPLVSRVLVNRIWQGHFGEGLVQTENDFGVMGYPPTHPELLDWLAAELIRQDWKLKPLHRLIVLSQTYGQSSLDRPEARTIDQENKNLWRFPYRRLEAEPVRDAILATNGTLDFSTGGPGIYPLIPAEVLAGQSRPGSGWHQSTEKNATRRAAYIFVKRSLLVPFMELMDLPDTTTACEQRNVSTIPTQALTLLNSAFMQEQAASLAARLSHESGDDLTAQVTRAYKLLFSRPPRADELRRNLDFLQRRLASDDETTRQQATASWCLVLYNLNEFFYID